MIKRLQERPNIEQNEKLAKIFNKTQNLIDALNEKEIPADITATIYEDIRLADEFVGTDKQLRKFLCKTYQNITKLIEKELGYVTKGYYRNQWMALGMAIFGIPFGLALSIPIGNMGMLGAGLPIGMAIGIAIGAEKDKKALEEGKQLPA